MKKLFLFLACLPVFAQGDVQQTLTRLGQTNNWVIALSWRGDPTTGAVPVTPLQFNGCCSGYFITQVETVPTTPAPTAGYSVAILDQAGVDVLAGTAVALSATVPQSFASSSSAPPVNSVVNLSITGQSVAGGRGIVYVFIGQINSLIVVPNTP